VLERVRPDAVVVEMFPFGRRRFFFELDALLDRCYELEGPRPALLCSVRDVLVRPGLGHHEKAAQVVTTYFDKVLVHGEAALLPFGTTFTQADAIAAKLEYTGYVVQPRALAAAAAGAAAVGGAVLVGGGGASLA
jgi:predicted glycosyltransferase